MRNKVDLIAEVIKAVIAKANNPWSKPGTGMNSDEAIDHKLAAAETRGKFKPSGKPVTGALNAAKLPPPPPAPVVKPTKQTGPLRQRLGLDKPPSEE